MLRIKGGIRPDEHKYTRNTFITDIPSPDTVKVFAYSDDISVSVGDEVKIGTALTVNNRAHSPVSGSVEAIENGYVVIRNNSFNETDECCLPFSIKLSEAKYSHIVSFIQTKAILHNGEFFDNRLRLAKEGRAKVLIINCGETAPFECTSYRIFAEHLNEILFGAKIIMKALGIAKAAVALETYRRDHIKALKSVVNKQKFFKILTHTPKYPASDPSVLRKSFFDRFGKASGFKAEEIFVVSAIEAYEVFKAFRTGMPQVNSVITVDGTAVHNPKVLRVPLGVSADYILNFCEAENINTVIAGNTLKGVDVNINDILKKDTVSLLAFEEELPSGGSIATECIGCGKCSKACPVGLEPIDLLKRNKYSEKCISCGVCTYICPSKYDFSCIYPEKEVSCEL